MSEMPGDGGDGDAGNVPLIPFLKFTGTPEVLTPTIVAGQDLFARYEVVNMGTAPTTVNDQVWCSAILQGTVLIQNHHDFDNPVIEANGGSHVGTVHISGEAGSWITAPGDWQLAFSIYNADNQSTDEATVTFTVTPAPDATAG